MDNALLNRGQTPEKFSEPGKPARIIVLAGQSNAVGVGHVECLPKHFAPERIRGWEQGFRNIKINYFSHDKKSGGFVNTSTGCTEVSKKTIGPELGIAEALEEQFPGEEFFIVKCAFGGTSLHTDWLSPSCGGNYDPAAFADQKDNIIANYFVGPPVRAGWCYNELVKLLGESIDMLKTSGYDPAIAGFCWMQGEGDADTPEHTAQYSRLYNCMLNDFKAAFGEYAGECVFVDAGISTVWPRYGEVNAAKLEYARAHDDCFFIDTIAAGFTTEHEPFDAPDIYHYDTDCVIRLGQLFAGPVIERLRTDRDKN